MSAGDATDRVKHQVEDGVAKAQRQYAEAKRQAEEVQRRVDAVPAAEDADEALDQVRRLRSAIDQDLAALESRIPPRDTVIGQLRAVGGAVVGVAALVGAVATILSQRKEKKAFEDEADQVAQAIARHLPAALAQVAPPAALAPGTMPVRTPRPTPQPEDDSGGGTGRKLAIVALLAGAAYAIYSQVKGNSPDPDLWGPPPAATTPPATPAHPEPAPDETRRTATVRADGPPTPPPTPPA